MEEKELYEKYGRLAIQLEIVQAQINEVKQQIAAKMKERNSDKIPKVEVKKDGKTNEDEGKIP